MSQEDFGFLMGTELLTATPDEAKSQLLSYLTRVDLKAGERLIAQGDRGDRFYVIQQGSCMVSVEKDDKAQSICRLKPGDLVGEMAILTGERRTAQVDAETDMVVWGVTKSHFDELCSAYMELRQFLTEIVTARLASTKITANKVIGKYTVNSVMGQGGWSIVYQGQHSSLHFPVAVKMLKHDMAMDPDFLQKFQDEASIIASLNHENIVKVYDIEHLYRTVFIVMECLSGMALDEILDTAPRMEFGTIVNLLVQVCNGLSYAHTAGIIHQDIKPANIFVQDNDVAKIVDFGLACPTGSEDSMGFAGTPHYMAPEQIEGDPVDARTDIYCLGITAFEMATGQRPFADKDVQQLLQSHCEAPMPDPRGLNPDLPDDFCTFVSRATQKLPDERYQSVAEALEDLTPLAERIGLGKAPHQAAKRRAMNLFMLYQDENLKEVNRAVENFEKELQRLGLEMRVAHFEDI